MSHSTNQISWHVELAVKPGALDRFRTLTTEMVEHTHRESGVLNYERYVSEDGGIVHVYERYVDSAAAMAHLLAFREKFGARFSELVERNWFAVHGQPSDELKTLLDQFGTTYLTPFDGVTG